MNPVIEIENIEKIYRKKSRKGLFKRELIEVRALDNISFNVEEGIIFSLLGPNGAGKTTLIKILTTLLLPTAGKARILGYDVVKEGGKIRKHINAMLMGERSIYWKLTGYQNLEYFASLYHIPRKVAKVKIDKLSEKLDLSDFINRKVETYSSGQKFKIAFAKSLLNDPKLIFLDEPTATLDPRAAREVREIIKQLNDEGTTIFLTTHNMNEADELSDEVAILDLGKIIEIDTPENLKEQIHTSESIVIDVPFIELRSKDKLLSDIRSLSFVSDIAYSQVVNGNGNKGEEKTKIRITTSKEINLSNIVNLFEKNSIPILSINQEKISLEDVFLSKTGRLLSEDTSKRV
ncbi:MAG: ATP-binding cassette domain-containing protein [Candidatus Heimdallarchaeum aukensis]|uniref:ATP-binding cassette domain-containing protein n=1 Tax=Candidatus Heimdallarchaeum aukensis TaxID=2876573 RepID=A0A9Y1BN45_9ARCH|nr:MAG: ATP-binding cassette domain-containing protein [Candidatus Heimdallarchaeum aukensis]